MLFSQPKQSAYQKNIKRYELFLGFILCFLAISLVFLPTMSTAQTNEENQCESLVKSAFDKLLTKEYRETLDYVDRAFGDAAPPSDCHARCMQAQSCAFLAMGNRTQAEQVLIKLLSVNPNPQFDNSFFPVPMSKFYRAVRDSFNLEVGRRGTLDIRTVAVLDFEVHNWVGYKFKDYDTEALGSAMQMIIASDLVEGANLIVVDRTNMSDILAELKLSSTHELIDKEFGIKLGKMMNAHAFVDGQITFIDKKRVRIDISVTHVATSRMMSRHYEGSVENGMELLEMQRGILAMAVDALNEFREDVKGAQKIETDAVYFDDLEKNRRGNQRTMETWLLKGDALDLEDQGEFKKALNIWEKILELDPENERARARIWALNIEEK